MEEGEVSTLAGRAGGGGARGCPGGGAEEARTGMPLSWFLTLEAGMAMSCPSAFCTRMKRPIMAPPWPSPSCKETE